MRFLPFVAAAYTAGLLVLLWARLIEPAALGLAGAATVVAFALAVPARHLPGRLHAAAALGLLALAVAVGVVAERRLARVASDWPSVAAERQARLSARLSHQMAAAVAVGRAAAREAAGEAGRDERLFAALAEVRDRHDVAAIAVVDAAGELVAWAGDHRGTLPAVARLGDRGIAYAERPLSSYLYFSEPVDGRAAHAVAAVLLQTGLPAGSGADAALASRFERAEGARPMFGGGAGADADWRLSDGERTVVHARFAAPTQAELHAQEAKRARTLVLLLVLPLLVLLTLLWLHAAQWRRRAAIPPLLAVAIALGLAPLGQALGLERFFSPAAFLLPTPRELSLGRLLALLMPLAALAAVHRQPAIRGRGYLWWTAAGVAVVAIGFPLVLDALLAAASPSLLEGGALLWLGLQTAAVLVLAVLAVFALPQRRPRRRPTELGRARGVRGLPLGLGLALAVALAVLTTEYNPARPTPWLAALWAAPFLLTAVGLAGHAGRGSRLLRWIVAGWLAATAVLPQVWAAHVEASLESAERELATLGAKPDPYLDYLLRQFAREAERRRRLGESGVELLYRSWVGSGLAREAYPVHITLWTPEGQPSVELDLGGAQTPAELRTSTPPPHLSALLGRARAAGEPLVEFTRASAEMGQALALALADGGAITAVVPPRRSLERPPGLAPFLGLDDRAESELTLVPVAESGGQEGAAAWVRTEEGWRSEARVRFPDGLYHAHYELRFAPAAVRYARGTLLLALDLGLLLLLWLAGRAAGREPPRPAGGWLGWSGSFRSRVTAALFAFFLIPTLAFGAVAYRALSGEVPRAARLLAERAVGQAAVAFPEVTTDLRALSAYTGEEVLFYHRGELANASTQEALEMGLFGAWMSPEVFLTLESGEETGAFELRELGRQPYLIAYERLAAGTLAVPIPLASGMAVVRQMELAHLIVFAALLGALLSLALSVLVGRALARPIGRLQRAAAAVGAGRLGVRLPEDRPDEFGRLFASFNQMVRRLRRARAREARTQRVLAWGEMARQVAHEIKNPLTPIKLSVQHLRRAYADRRPDFGEILETQVSQILVEIDRLGDIARVFSRYGALPEAAGPLEEVDVAAVVRETLTLYATGEDGARFQAMVREGLPPALARAGELKQVLLNLLENARAAIGEDGGDVEVGVDAVDGGIELVVRDTGVGIPPDQLPRIFEPQFSTRSTGTGLGLAIVRRLVEGWGGGVAAESEPGRGTTVTVHMRTAAPSNGESGS